MSLLIISGNPSEDQLLEAWENIIKISYERNGDNRYNSYLILLKSYALLLEKHTTVVAHLLKLTLHLISNSYPIDFNSIKEVKRLGYNVDIYTPELFAETLEFAKERASGLITKYESRRKEMLKNYGGTTEGKAKSASFIDVVASLKYALGRAQILIVIDHDKLTLAEFNKFKSMLPKEK